MSNHVITEIKCKKCDSRRKYGHAVDDPPPTLCYWCGVAEENAASAESKFLTNRAINKMEEENVEPKNPA